MTPVPPHGSSAAEAVAAIRKLARTTGQDVQDLMTIYALEGLLARLSRSIYRDTFILKGGALLAAFALRRATRDLDLQAIKLDNEPAAIAARIAQIATINIDDGIIFNSESIKVNTIRDRDQYAGIRVSMIANLGTARLKIGVDVNFGDPIWPEPDLIQVPHVVNIGLEPVTIMSYPLTMILGEKIVTIIQRGVANTRWRDFADIYNLIGIHQVEADNLAASMRVIADYRTAELVSTLPMLEDMPERAQPKWLSWRIRSDRIELPEQFADVLHAISNFVDPIISEQVRGNTWNPQIQHWQ